MRDNLLVIAVFLVPLLPFAAYHLIRSAVQGKKIFTPSVFFPLLFMSISLSILYKIFR